MRAARALEHPERGSVSDPGLHEWIALRRVHDGGVAKSAGAYFEDGRPAPEHLTGAYDRLIWTGLVVVADGDPLWELRQLGLTEGGQARYAVLSELRRESPPVPPPEHNTQTIQPTIDPRSAGLSR